MNTEYNIKSGLGYTKVQYVGHTLPHQANAHTTGMDKCTISHPLLNDLKLEANMQLLHKMTFICPWEQV